MTSSRRASKRRAAISARRSWIDTAHTAWGDDEDAVLLKERRRGTPYQDIAEMLEGRTRSACENRYHVLSHRSDDESDANKDEDSDLEQSRAYSSWTKTEEQRLLRLKKEMKDTSWAEIASNIEGRSASACSNRYLLLIRSGAHINADDEDDDGSDESDTEIESGSEYSDSHRAKPKNWSKRETNILRRQREENNASWTDISQLLPNRSAGACRERYSRIMKERNKNRHNRKLRDYPQSS